MVIKDNDDVQGRIINPRLLSKWSKRLKGVMTTYDSQVWDLNDLVVDVETLKTMEQEATEFISSHEKNLSRFCEADCKDFHAVQKFKKHLTRKREYLEQLKLDHSTPFAAHLMYEKNSLQSQLNSRENVERLVLQIHQEMELAKYELLCETRYRMELEILLESKIRELNSKILFEAQARNELNQKLQRAMEIKKNIGGNLDLLKENLQMILEHQEHDAESIAEERRSKLGIPSHPHDVVSLLNLAGDIENKLVSLTSLVDFSGEDVLLPANSTTRKIEELTKQVTLEMTVRKAAEEKHINLESQVACLQNLLFEERLARIDKSDA